MNYVDEDGTSGSGEDVNMLDGHKRHPVGVPSGSGSGRKRSRKASGDAMVDAMLEIAAASKMRATTILKNEDKFSISKCIKVLDELQGVDDRVYFLALDLFENSSTAREIFISLKGEKRLPWLQEGVFNLRKMLLLNMPFKDSGINSDSCMYFCIILSTMRKEMTGGTPVNEFYS